MLSEAPIIHNAITFDPEDFELIPKEIDVGSAFPEGAKSNLTEEEKATVDRLIEAIPDENDPLTINYWRTMGNKMVYLEGWCDECLAGQGFPDITGGERRDKIEFMLKDANKVLIEKQEEKRRPIDVLIPTGHLNLIEGGFREFEAGDKGWLYGVTWGLYEKEKAADKVMVQPNILKEEEIAFEREPIPYTPVKRLERGNLYVMERDIPHPIHGYSKYHKEYSVVDLRMYRKGYEPRLDIKGLYTPNPNDTFRIGTGRLPPYQPTTTGDKLQEEMERLGFFKAWRISPMKEGNPVPKLSKKVKDIIGDREGIPATINVDSPVQHLDKGDEVIAYFSREFELGGLKGAWVKEYDVLLPDGTMSLGVSKGQLDFVAIPKAEPGMPEVKEPWQMTQAEFAKVYPFPAGANAVHRSAVFGAIYQGKPVPPEVLADYPDLRTREGNPTTDKRLVKVAIEREPLKVARQLGYEVHRLSSTDIVDKADYASGYRFRLSKAIPNQPYPQIVMARNEGEVATFLKRETEAENPSDVYVVDGVEVTIRYIRPGVHEVSFLAPKELSEETLAKIDKLIKEKTIKPSVGGKPTGELTFLDLQKYFWTPGELAEYPMENLQALRKEVGRAISISPFDTSLRIADDLLRAAIKYARKIKPQTQTVPENAALRTSAENDNAVRHLGYEPVDAGPENIPLDIELIRSSQERLSKVQLIPDHQLTRSQAASLSLARAMCRGSQVKVVGAIIPPASDRVSTAGMYGVSVKQIYIHLDQLNRGKATVDTTIHELAHDSSGGAEDGTERHNAELRRLAGDVVKNAEAGHFDKVLRDTAFSW